MHGWDIHHLQDRCLGALVCRANPPRTGERRRRREMRGELGKLLEIQTKWDSTPGTSLPKTTILGVWWKRPNEAWFPYWKWQMERNGVSSGTSNAWDFGFWTCSFWRWNGWNQGFCRCARMVVMLQIWIVSPTAPTELHGWFFCREWGLRLIQGTSFANCPLHIKPILRSRKILMYCTIITSMFANQCYHKWGDQCTVP